MLQEAAPARPVLIETERVLERRPDLGFLAQDAAELRERVAAIWHEQNQVGTLLEVPR